MIWLLLVGVCLGDEKTHTYTKGEEVVLWFNKLAPVSNPQETYSYQEVPLCTGSKKKNLYSLGLGEALEGNKLTDSGLDIQFLENTHKQRFCTKRLLDSEVSNLVSMIARSFWLQMYIDDLPMWTEIGKVDKSTGDVYIFTHYEVLISFNHENIIQVQVHPGSLQKIFDAKTKSGVLSSLELHYSVSWLYTTMPFSRRFETYLDPGFFENNIHWFSVLNSLLMVLVLCGTVGLIVWKTVKKNSSWEDLEDSNFWKKTAALRPPKHLELFTGLYSSGTHILGVACVGLGACALHPMYAQRGMLTSILLVAYTLLGVLGGYVFSYFYCSNAGTKWAATGLYSMLLFPSVGVLNWFLMPKAIWVFAGVGVFYVLLFVVGAVVGRVVSVSTPTKKHSFLPSPSTLTTKPWHSSPGFLVAFGGVLPFGSISVETYFIFTSFWNYKFYYVYGFAVLMFLILVLCLVCVSVVATYVTLSNEDYRWHWVSFLSSGSVGGYLLLYSCYYYLFKTQMDGYLQTAYYFGATGVLSFATFLLAGAIGYSGSLLFVNKLFKDAKND